MIKICSILFVITCAGVTVGYYTAPSSNDSAPVIWPPPVEAAVAQAADVGTVMVLPPLYIEAPKSSPLPPKPRPKPAHFFDFDRAKCDEANAIHGRVLRCYQ